MCLIENRGRLLARTVNDVLGFDLRLVETVLSAFRSSKAVSDLRLTFLDRVHDRWPDELHAEPDEHEHRDRLT